MSNKARAENGGQAAIGDILNQSINGIFGQLSGNNTVVIQHLHITTAPAVGADEAPAGLIAYFGLKDWWLQTLTEGERAAIEDAIGEDVCKSTITATSRTASLWLRSVALRIGAVHPGLASKLRAKASGLETGVELDDYWRRQLDEVRLHWQRLDFDVARGKLSAISYRMREENALPEARAAFNEVQAALLHADPYYAEVMAIVLPIIKSRPVVIQAVLAKELRDIDIERFRYVMYYAEVIGDIAREKKGRSYTLSVPEKK